MISWLFTFLWPLVREIIANILSSPELQGRDKRGGITKTIIALLFIALIAVGDLALDAHAELQKLKLESKEQKIVSSPTQTQNQITEDRVQLMFCQANNTALEKQGLLTDDLLLAARRRIAELEEQLRNCGVKEIPPTNKNDRRVAERLERIRKDDR